MSEAEKLLQGAVDRWRYQIEHDKPINGGDCVEWLSEFYDEAVRVLNKTKGVK